jgi:aspartate kinase
VADANIEVDVIIQNVSKDGKTDFSFTVHRNDYARTMELLWRQALPPWVPRKSWATPRSAR